LAAAMRKRLLRQRASLYVARSVLARRSMGRRASLPLGCPELLLKAIIERSRHLGMCMLIACIGASSKASPHVHEKCGFVTVGTVRDAPYKNGTFLSSTIMQYFFVGNYKFERAESLNRTQPPERAIDGGAPLAATRDVAPPACYRSAGWQDGTDPAWSGREETSNGAEVRHL
jgi:hypothetical protein